MPQFDINSLSSQLFWLAAVFAVLYFVINKFIAPKAESIFSNRHNYLEENIDYAQKYKDKAKSLENFGEDKLVEISQQAEDLNQQTMFLLDMQFNEKKSALSLRLEENRKKALEEIKDYVNRFHEEQPQYCIKLAAIIIEKLTNKGANMQILEKIYGEYK